MALDFEGQLEISEALERISNGDAIIEVKDNKLLLRTGNDLFECHVSDTIGTDLFAVLSNEGIQVVSKSTERLLMDQKIYK